MNRNLSSLLVLLCVACGSCPAPAAISGGTVMVIAPPLNVGNNNQQSSVLLGFNERQNQLLAADLQTDQPGTPILAGMRVSSHYLIFDPQGTSSIVGTAEFDGDILGVISSRDMLIESDFLGAVGTNYLSPNLRGLEAGDIVTITGLRSISVDFTASTPGDYIRVITVGVIPEPAGLAMLGLLAAFVGRLRPRHA